MSSARNSDWPKFNNRLSDRENIIGNLEKLGWVVLRNIDASIDVSGEMNDITNEEKWKSIVAEKERLTKYGVNRSLPSLWNDDQLMLFREEIEKKL